MALSASQYAFLKLNLRAFSSANRYIVANLSEADLLGFWNQLATDSASAVALGAAQDAAVDRTVRAMLCANNSFLALPNADWSSFFTQLATDSAGAASLPAAQYTALKLQLRALISGYSVTPFNLSEADLLGYLKPRIGNSTPLTIITSTTVKLWTDSQLGAGANAWADQSGNGNNFTEATNPPALTTLGGVPCYVANGTNQLFTATALTLTIGQWYWIIARQITWLTNGSLCGGAASASASILSLSLSTPQVAQFNSTEVNTNGAMTLGTWFRVKALFGNSTADYLQVGATKVTGASTGPGTETGWQIFTRQSFGWGNFAIAAVVVCPAEPTAPEQAALDAYGAARWPGVTF